MARPIRRLTLWAVFFSPLFLSPQASTTEQEQVGEATLFASELLAAPTAEERKQKVARNPHLVNSELVQALVRHGHDLTGRGQFAEATTADTLAMELSEQIHYREGRADALRELGGVHYAKREHQAALELFQKSLKQAQEADYKLGIAKALTSIGNIYFRQGDLTRAFQHQQDALKLAEPLADNDAIGWALNGMAQVYQQQGKFEQALQIQTRILELRKESADSSAIASALGNIGNIYLFQANYPKALEFYAKTLEVAEKNGVRMLVPLAINNMGNVYLEQGNYIEALQRFNRSVQIAEELGAKGLAADGLSNVGKVHYDQGDDEQALVFYEKSLALYEQMGAIAPAANMLLSIGSVYSRKQNYTKALEFYSKALKMNERVRTPLGVAAALENTGHVHLRQSHYRQAERFYERALALDEAAENPIAIAGVLRSLARLYLLRGDFSRAIDSATRAARLAADVAQDDVVADARVLIGDSHRALRRLDEAQRAYSESIEIIERMRERIVGGAEERELFFENMVAPYYAMIGLSVERGEVTRALEYSERVKGRVLLDVLRSGRSKVGKAMTPEEREREEKLIGEIAWLNTAIAKEASKKQSAGALSTLQTRLREARLARNSFESELFLAHPELRAQRGEVAAVGVKELGELLRNGRRAVLEFVVGKEESFLLLVTQAEGAGNDPALSARVEAFPLKTTSEKLARLVSGFRQQLTPTGSGYRERGRRLFQQLVSPVSSRLRRVTELCIVPDGPLWDLPFQALVGANGRYLVEDFAIFYASSLAVLREMETVRQKMLASSSGSASILALGNPLASRPMVQRIHAAHRDEVLVPLPEAEREVNALRQLYGVEHSAVYTGAEAREERVKSEAGQYSILHLATHGRLDERNPLYSHLVLAPPAEGSKEDGLLEAWEVMKLDLRAQLAVLSACQTARGRISTGEGVIGMAWAFFVAGVPTTVVSHWTVDSNSTTELMVAFHKHLTSGDQPRLSRAEALRRAEVQLLNRPRFHHPYYWASFAVVGEGG